MSRDDALRFAALLTMFAMVTSWVPMSAPDYQLQEFDERREQLGGDGPTLEEQCSSITFEDMFEYSKAIFDIEIANDWNSAQVEAVVWVNASLADAVRQSLDEYVAAVYPSGDDGWISTDEREGVRAIASECVQHTLTRLALRDGSPHRGGEGTDWKNVSWTEDEVLVEEWNLVPPRHSEIRDCSGFGSSSDCVEVPVSPDSARDCDTDIDASAGVDECRMMLWLNATLTISNVDDPSQFTVAFNASNMSEVEYHIQFPQTDGLRLDMWEECEGRDVEAAMGDYAGSAPLRGSCVGDGSSSYAIQENEDGSLTYSFYPDMPQWPVGEDLFADFTTAPIPVDEPPVWTEDAPDQGVRFAALGGGLHKVADWDELSSWFSDEAGVASLDIECHDGDGEIELEWNILQVQVPNDGSVNVFTCEAIDSANQSSGVRSWEIGVPFTVSTSSLELLDPHSLTITPNEGWGDLEVTVKMSQPLLEGGGFEISGPFDIGQSETTIEAVSTSMIPGDVWFMLDVEGVGVRHSSDSVSLNVKKSSQPPSIVVNSEGWDGNSWSMSGQFSDPDGEAVTFTLLIDGVALGEVSVTGNTWSTPAIDFSFWAEGVHEIMVHGCDESGVCTSQQRSVNNSHLFVEPEPEPEPPTEPTSGLPAMGLPGLILAASAALIYSGRRD